MILNTPVNDILCDLDNKGVNNMSSHTLLCDELTALAQGPKFRLPPKITQDEFYKDIDDYTRSIRLRYQWGPENNELPKFFVPHPEYKPDSASPSVERYLTDVTDKLRLKYLEFNHRDSWYYPNGYQARLQRTIQRGIASLRANHDIVIKPADKNLGLTVMDKTWYVAQVQSHLHDPSTYAVMEGKSPEQVMETLGKGLKVLVGNLFPADSPRARCHYNSSHRTEHISRTGAFNTASDPPHTLFKLREYLLQYLPGGRAKPQLPQFYILPKLHKTPVASRPISGSHSNVTTPLASWVASKLQPITRRKEWVIKDSRQVMTDLIRTQPTLTNVPREQIWLVTGDVTSLYPSINTADALDRLRGSMASYYPNEVDSKRILSSLSFLLYNHYAEWNGNVYKQVSGTAMGVQFAPDYANIYMDTVLHEAVADLPAPLRETLKYVGVYIDDIMIIATGEAAQVSYILSTLSRSLAGNGIGLKITWEKDRRHIAFLDLDITLTPASTFQFQVHSKAINKFLYIPYGSFHPPGALKSFIYTELLRFKRLSSTAEAFECTKARFHRCLRARGYPAAYLNANFARVNFTPPSLTVTTTADLASTGGPVHADQGLRPRIYKTTWSRFHETFNLRRLLEPGLPDWQRLTESARARAATLGGRLIVAYRNGGNLGQRLCSAKFSG